MSMSESPGRVLVVVEVEEILDQDAFRDYLAQPGSDPERHGGRIIARAQAPRTLESSRQPVAVIVQEWPSSAAFQAWQDSAAYQPVLAMRRKALRARIVIVPASGSPAQPAPGTTAPP